MHGLGEGSMNYLARPRSEWLRTAVMAIPSVFFLVAIVWSFLKDGTPIDSLSLIVIGILTVMAVVTPFAIKHSRVFGYIYWVVGVAWQIPFGSSTLWDVDLGMGSVALPAMGIHVLLFFSSIPVAVLPELRQRIGSRATGETARTGTHHKVDEALRGLNEAQRLLGSQVDAATRALSMLGQGMQTGRDELAKLQHQMSAAREELDQQRAILSLSEVQQSALLSKLGRQRYVDYIVGFGLGILSAFAWDMLKSVLAKLVKGTMN